MSGNLKPFQEHGHYTSVHDAVFDVVMPYCPPNAFKVLLFVLRKTRGWKKEEDVLRYAEIKSGTGIKSDATLAKELAWLLKKKLLNARDESGGEHVKGTRKAPAYSLNRDFELRISTSETEVPDAATTTENEVATTSETEASNNQLSQEPSSSKESNDSLSGEPAKTPDTPTPEIDEKVKPQAPGAFAVSELMDRVNAARKRGWDLHDPPSPGNYGQFFKNRLKRNEPETLLLALDYLVTRAAGEIDGEKKAWCGFDTALDAVNAGWRGEGQVTQLDSKRQERIDAENAENERLLQELMSDG